MTTRWLKLVDRAIWNGDNPALVRPSEWLASRAEHMTQRLWMNAGVSFCQHVRTDAVTGGMPDMVAFPGSDAAVCRGCVGSFRDEELMRRGRPPTCERCDEVRATALHYGETGVVEGEIVLVLAVPLCEGCAAAEGLRDRDTDAGEIE